MKSNIRSDVEPDFSRDVWCVLGLPFDALTEVQAEAAVRKAVAEQKRCFMSTPNLNFAVACLRDSAFRASVLQSDLSLADGWPVISYARLSDVHLPERVAGASLFERLQASNQRPPLSVYFFGGPIGAAQAACRQLSAKNGGVRSAGFEAPGYGSIEEMSTAEQIDRINQARPDILALALGAQKGQVWIQRNLRYLDVPVVSHLGAVVNFVAGSVKRAPAWVQTASLEWLWRVIQEPSLWRRYANDGAVLTNLFAKRMFARAMSMRPAYVASAENRIATMSIRTNEADLTIILTGSWVAENLAHMREEFSRTARQRVHVRVDLAEVTRLDPAAIGLMTLLYGWLLKIDLTWKIVACSDPARSALRSAHAEYLLE